ncbi:MAG: hypothetical protein Q4A05_04725, partial [Ruminococcus sp.]|nr:hypothetical protein [Ruminococcus sp.]
KNAAHSAKATASASSSHRNLDTLYDLYICHHLGISYSPHFALIPPREVIFFAAREYDMINGNTIDEHVSSTEVKI